MEEVLENIPSGLYKCVMCGTQISSQVFFFEVKCPNCGYRVFERVEPLSEEYIKETYIDPFDRFVRRIGSIIDEAGEIKIEKPRPFSIKLGEIEFRCPRVIEFDGSVYPIYLGEALFRNLAS